jgi:D-sedoheptulose 7-phosphate isomerase
MREYIRQEVSKTLSMVEQLAGDDHIAAEIEKIAKFACQALRDGHKILFAGNGGSAADAQHLATELVSRLNFDRPGLAAIALTTDSSVLTAVGNDYGYDQVFARQLNALGAPGDIFCAISTSGKSPNILAALREARRKNLITVGFTSQSGGEMPPWCDYCLHVPAAETQKIQEGHILLGHILCGLIEREMFGAN